MKLFYVAFALMFASTSISAEATTSILSVSGNITHISALQDTTPTATPSGSISAGDKYSLTAAFDFSAAQLTSLYDADPHINIYYLPGTTVTLTIGSYSTTFQPKYEFNSSIQIWNDYIVVGPVDSQSFEFFNYNVDKSKMPFDLGSGLFSQSISFNAFDFTHSARTNDLLSEIKPFSLFGSQLFTMGLLNADTKAFVYVEGSVTQAALESSVPEPSTWAMMIIGFGAVSALARHRKRVTVDI